MKKFMVRLWKEEEGQDLIEYVLLVALIGLATAAVFPAIAGAITGVLNNAITCLGGGACTI